MSRSTIAFLGQCHTSGYEGVPPDLTFPQVCRRDLESRRPGTKVDVVILEYHHPGELPRMTARALRARPRAVVIEAVGWLAVNGRPAVDLSRLPRPVSSAYERVRHFRRVTTLISARLPRAAGAIYRIQTGALDLTDGVLGALIPRYPRPTLEDYESCLDMALDRIAAVPGVGAIVQGPGAPALTFDSRRLPADTLDRYRAVASLARRAALRRGALYVDRWDSVGTGFFLPGTIRPSAGGHLVWGHLLAEALEAGGWV